MIPKHYARKRRQLRFLSKQLERKLQQTMSGQQARLEDLIGRMRRLAQELSGVFSKRQLRRLVGAAAVFIGLAAAQQAQAQSFAAPEVNPFNITPFGYLSFPAFTDLDNDGDLDLLVFKGYNDMTYNSDILFYENIGTPQEPDFEVPLLNPYGLNFNTVELGFITTVDLDGDGDDDILAGQYEGNMFYFENAGTPESPSFEAPVMNPFGLTPTTELALPEFVDIDNDGDMDLFVGDYPNKVVFFKNTGDANNPQFAIPQSNTYGLVPLSEYSIPAFGDLDLDGDPDLLLGDGDGNLTVYTNAGTPTAATFALGQANPFGLTATILFSFPEMGDLDNDGDMDLLVSQYGGELVYFENTELSGTSTQYRDFGLTLSPNPTTGQLNIESAEALRLVQLFDATGRMVLSMDDPGQHVQLDLSVLPTGIYSLQAVQEDGYFTSRTIQKQ